MVAAVIQHEETFLVCQRPDGKRHGGLWEFPGGKCDIGESDEDAMRRELAEELGVVLSHLGRELCCINDAGSEFEIAFFATAISGEPQSLEHAAVQWCAAKALVDLPFAPSDKAFLKRQLLVGEHDSIGNQANCL